ncbi:hypothetical protein JTE90_026041 [Oedothorax gibbosus]|uniref:Uncharacterized protein n=1 Tax=Oedothorax gibbosus TaxID=931172 RepID=A0AAV6UCU8_9ARAC|nr:hypothetical protein JTE90_026041 [Oedothorax gibbosus]
MNTRQLRISKQGLLLRKTEPEPSRAISSTLGHFGLKSWCLRIAEWLSQSLPLAKCWPVARRKGCLVLPNAFPHPLVYLKKRRTRQ